MRMKKNEPPQMAPNKIKRRRSEVFMDSIRILFVVCLQSDCRAWR